MKLLYESETFDVVHVEKEDSEREGFEILNKRDNSHIFLVEPVADAFVRQIKDWQTNVPSQREVERVLNGYTRLAMPRHFH